MFGNKVESNTIQAIDRKRIFIFVAITHGTSIALGLVIYFNGGLYNGEAIGLSPLAAALLGALMFAPTVANLVTRLVTREGWSNMMLWPNFRRGWPFYLAGLVLPAVATIVGGAIYYLLFPGQFDPTMKYALEELGMVFVGGQTSVWAFLVVNAGNLILVSITTIPVMFGEEFGWRGYLLPKLMPLGGRKAVLLVGIIWAIWHWPAIFMGYEYGFDYWGAPVVGPLLFVVITFFFSTFLSWLTLRSGSVWPAAFGHGVINISPMLVLAFIRGTPDLLIGPIHVGIIGSLGYALLALLLYFSARALTQPEFSTVDVPLPNNPGAAKKTAHA